MANIAVATEPFRSTKGVAFRQPLSGLRKRFFEDAQRSAANAQPPPSIETVIETIPGPDIQWNPSFETFQARVEALSKLDVPRPQNVPEAFPAVVAGPHVWTGAEFEDESKYAMQLSEAEVFEIERALSFFKSSLYCA